MQAEVSCDTRFVHKAGHGTGKSIRELIDLLG
jgi:hypothetical protein